MTDTRWHKISEAKPRSGAYVIAYNAPEGYMWRERAYGSDTNGYLFLLEGCTHWRYDEPLPDPPLVDRREFRGFRRRGPYERRR